MTISYKITNPPGILKNKFEALEIKTIDDLVSKIQTLRMMPGYGKKCEEEVTKLLSIGLAENIENGNESEENDMATHVERDSSEVFDSFCQSLAFEQDSFIVTVPKFFAGKFEQAEIGTPSDLREKYHTLIRSKGFGTNSQSELDLFLIICTKINNAHLENSDFKRIDLIEAFNDAINDFFVATDPRLKILYEKRILTKTATCRDLAPLFGLSHERVRQIENDYIFEKCKNYLLGLPCDGTPAISSHFTNVIALVYKELMAQPCTFYDEFKALIRKYQDKEIGSQDWNTLKSLLNILGFTLCSTQIFGCVEEVILPPNVEKSEFEHCFTTIVQQLQENVTPTDFISLVISVKKTVGKSFDHSLIQKLLSSSKFIIYSNNKAELKCRYLKSIGDRAESILAFSKQPIHYKEIFREINHRIVTQGGKAIDNLSSNQFVKNPRLVPLGKTGKWALAEWKVDSRALLERLIECFHFYNTPLAFEKIAEFDSIKNSSYPISSVYSYLKLGIGETFYVIETGEYILSSWRNSYEVDLDGTSRYDKESFHTRLKSILGEASLTLREIADKFYKQFEESISLTNLDQRLQSSISVSKTLFGNTNRWKWIREYAPAIKITKQMRIAEKALSYFDRQEQSKVKLLDLRNFVCKALDISNISFYKVVSEDDRFIKEVDSSGQICIRVWKSDVIYNKMEPIKDEMQTEIEHALRAGEGERIEFKSSLQWDIRESRKNKELHQEIQKTIAAFANSRGGILIIGVDDSSDIIGLDGDFSLISKENKFDGFDLLLSSVIDYAFEKWLSLQLIRKHVTIGEKNIYSIKVPRSNRPVFVKSFIRNNKNIPNAFFVRHANQTDLMTDQYEFFSYCRERFAEFIPQADSNPPV